MKKYQKKAANPRLDEFVYQTKKGIESTARNLAEITQTQLDLLKSRREAFEVRKAAAARQTFPEIVPFTQITSTSSSSSIKNSSPARTNFVRLNVGGKPLDISRSTLTHIEGSRLALTFSGQWDEMLPHDKNGRIFIDFDPSWLEPIFDQLRDLAIYDSPRPLSRLSGTPQYAGVGLVAQYFGLTSLMIDNAEPIEQVKTLFTCEIAHELLYRGSRDGFTAAAFHAKCNGVAGTVMIVQDTKGSVFGGYSDVACSSSRAYAASSKSFLFSLSIRGVMNPQMCRFKEKNNRHSDGYYGDNYSGYEAIVSFSSDLKISGCCDQAAYSSCNLGFSYTSPDSTRYFLTGGDQTFRVQEIEVYRAYKQLDVNPQRTTLLKRSTPLETYPLATSVQGAQTALTELLTAHHSMLDFLNDIDRQNNDLAYDEKEFDKQILFIRKYVDRMMKLKPSLESKSSEDGIQPSDRIITFNVGNTIISVSMAILSQIPESMLWSGYGSGRWRMENHQLDDNGNIFLDHNPSYFSELINFLRIKSLSYLDFLKFSAKIRAIDSAEMNNYRSFLEYFQVDQHFVGLSDFDSNIDMEESHLMVILSHLAVSPEDLQLIFRGSSDGFTAAAFHAKCDGVADTIMIVQDTKGSVFGGYSDVACSSSGAFVASTKSFLFSLSIRGVLNPQIFPWRVNYGRSLFGDRCYMGSFGGCDMVSFGGCDMRITSNCNSSASSTTELGNVYASPNSQPYFLTGGDNAFQVSEIEVWKIDK